MKEDVFTIGFARRAAAYKRADLFSTILKGSGIHKVAGPIQIIYAGKAHPRIWRVKLLSNGSLKPSMSLKEISKSLLWKLYMAMANWLHQEWTFGWILSTSSGSFRWPAHESRSQWVPVSVPWMDGGLKAILKFNRLVDWQRWLSPGWNQGTRLKMPGLFMRNWRISFFPSTIKTG